MIATAAKTPLSEKVHSKPLGFKSLNDIMKLELLDALETREIADIWNQYFSKRSGISGTITPQVYARLQETSQRYPFFILPLPKEEGYEFYFLQFSGHQIYLTSLLEYQTHGSFAKPLFIVTHYTDLLSSKNVVLMMGEFGDPDQPRISLQEAQNLVYQIQLFYVTGDDSKRGLLEAFHDNPKDFDYKRLIDALETLQK